MKKRIELILNSVRPEFDFSKSNNFIEDGLLDSFDLIQIVSELDNQFLVSIEAVDIVPENFSNLDGIESMLLKYVEK